MYKKAKVGFIEINEKIILFVIILVLFVHGLIILNYPPMKDNSMFLYIGKGLLNGDVPFRDNFDMKPPIIYFIYAFISMFFGGAIKGVYLFDLLYTLVTCLAVWKLAKYLFGNKVGLLAAFLYGFLYFTYGNVWYYGQAESFSNLPIILGIYFFFLERNEKKYILLFLSGLFLGIAFLLKFPLVIWIMLLMMIVFLKDVSGRRTKKILMFLLGFVAIHIPVFIYFSLNSAFGEMIYALFVYTPQYAKNIDVSFSFFQGIKKIFDFFAVYTAPIAVFSLLGLVKISKNSLVNKFVCGWYAVSLLNVIIQGKFFEHHWIPVYVPLSILGGLGIIYFLNNFNKYRLVFSVILFCGFIFSAIFFLRIMSFYRDNIKYISGRMPQEIYFTRFGKFPSKHDFSPSSNETIADYIKQNTKTGDFIYVWGAHPEVYILSERRSSSRFLMAHQLYCSWAPAKWKEDFLKELEKNIPQLIIVTKGDFFPEVSGAFKDSWQQLKEFEQFYTLLMDKYYLAKQIDMFEVYKLKVVFSEEINN